MFPKVKSGVMTVSFRPCAETPNCRTETIAEHWDSISRDNVVQVGFSLCHPTQVGEQLDMSKEKKRAPFTLCTQVYTSM